MKKEISVRTVVAVAIGVALFVVLGRFGSIPTGIPNTEFSLGYPVLALFAALFGPFAGLLIGFIGHTLKDAIFYGSPWWSWIISSGILGVCFGLVGRRLKIEKGIFSTKDIVLFNVTNLVSNVLVWGLLAPSLDVLIYSEPSNKVYTQGLTASIVNVIGIALIGTVLLKIYAATRVKEGSLSKEDE